MSAITNSNYKDGTTIFFLRKIFNICYYKNILDSLKNPKVFSFISFKVDLWH